MDFLVTLRFMKLWLKKVYFEINHFLIRVAICARNFPFNLPDNQRLLFSFKLRMFQDSQVWIDEQIVAEDLPGNLGTCPNLATSTNMPCLPHPGTVGWGPFWWGPRFCLSCCHPQLLSQFLLKSSLPLLSPYRTMSRLSLRGCLKLLTY